MMFLRLALIALWVPLISAGWFQKKKYTPLVFFKVPPQIIPECDAMEVAVCQLEKELGVRVERLDILRDPAAEATLALLTQKSPPFLYNRESGQSIHIPSASSSGSKKPVVVTQSRMRAWAKGRFLKAPKARIVEGIQATAPDAGEDDLDDMIEDMALSDTQLEGKKKMKERTAEKSE